MHIHDCLRLSKLRGRKTGVVGQNHLWREPEFRLAIDMCNMYMDACFLPGKEEQTKLAVTNNGWRHSDTVTNSEELRTLWSQACGRKLDAAMGYRKFATRLGRLQLKCRDPIQEWTRHSRQMPAF